MNIDRGHMGEFNKKSANGYIRYLHFEQTHIYLSTYFVAHQAKFMATPADGGGGGGSIAV